MKLSLSERIHAQMALVIAIILQVIVWRINDYIFSQFQYISILVEIALVVLLGVTSSAKSLRGRALQHSIATLLIALVTLINFASLAIVIYTLIQGTMTDGPVLLGSAIAIFFTNIIVYALWYWEIDSPGLTNRRWNKNDRDFQFTQQRDTTEFKHWQPHFTDYLYLSIINSLNGATTGATPITAHAKLLMASQALISILTLALVIARSVGILG